MTENTQKPMSGITVATSRSWEESSGTEVATAKQTADCQSRVGQHLIVDFHGARHLTDVAELQSAIENAVQASGATLLHIHLHQFNNGEGITGVALLAESHISVHTWPENDYAAFDIFMCGTTDPYPALDSLRANLQPEREEIRHIPRG